jgi:hypothetical protein
VAGGEGSERPVKGFVVAAQEGSAVAGEKGLGRLPVAEGTVFGRSARGRKSPSGTGVSQGVPGGVR